jgi:hypothetical protein
MEGLRRLLKNLSVQHPTKVKFSFPPCRKEKFSSVPIFAMVQMMLRFGHNPGWTCIVTWVPFQESPTIQMILFPSCGGTQLAMISNLLKGALSMD